jgi:IS605 OrfB family transposase
MSLRTSPPSQRTCGAEATWASWVPLARCTRWAAHDLATLEAALWLAGSCDNFCTPHRSLRQRLDGPGARQRRWRELEARYVRLRRALHSKDTRSVKRHLRRLSGKQLRLRRDLDHQLSRQIVTSVASGSILVVENLTNIRTRVKHRTGKQNGRLHGWSFAQLRSFLSDKAEEKGCTVVGVDLRHTSQTCPRCGHVDRHNRRSQSGFRCRDCGFRLNADLVGARNIAAKYRASVGTPDAGRADRQPAYRVAPWSSWCRRKPPAKRAVVDFGWNPLQKTGTGYTWEKCLRPER